MAKFYAKAPNGDDAVLSISIQAFTQSLQQNGWCKLPNGLIIQWFVKSTIDTGWDNNFITIPFHIQYKIDMFAGISSLTGDSVSPIAIHWMSTREVKINITYKRSSAAGIIVTAIGY